MFVCLFCLCVQTPSPGNSTRHIEIDLAGTGLHYGTADDLAVLPDNSPSSVAQLAKWLGYEGDLDRWFILEKAEGVTVRLTLARTHTHALTLAHTHTRLLTHTLIFLPTRPHCFLWLCVAGREEFVPHALHGPDGADVIRGHPRPSPQATPVLLLRPRVQFRRGSRVCACVCVRLFVCV